MIYRNKIFFFFYFLSMNQFHYFFILILTIVFINVIANNLEKYYCCSFNFFLEKIAFISSDSLSYNYCLNFIMITFTISSFTILNIVII